AYGRALHEDPARPHLGRTFRRAHHEGAVLGGAWRLAHLLGAFGAGTGCGWLDSLQPNRDLALRTRVQRPDREGPASAADAACDDCDGEAVPECALVCCPEPLDLPAWPGPGRAGQAAQPDDRDLARCHGKVCGNG